MKKTLMKGTEVIAEASIQAGCKYFFGYPITPQNEIPEYMSKRLPEVGGVYLQAESEVAASNMILGAGAVGVRVMTTSSSPGVSLMSETISYMAGQEVPAVIVNVMRAGPGLGGILPGQSDYNQAVCGMGHGDCNFIVMAPGSLQEVVGLMRKAFELAEEYRNPVIVICDGVIGQIMEAVEIPDGDGKSAYDPTGWAAGYMDKRGSSVIVRSLFLDPAELEEQNKKLNAKWLRITEKEKMCEKYMTDDARLVIAAFGTTARISRSVVNNLRGEGMKIGLIRPIIVNPFPYEEFESLLPACEHILDAEMNLGQMIRDVKAGVKYKIPVSFYGRSGGFSPSDQEIEDECRRIYAELA